MQKTIQEVVAEKLAASAESVKETVIDRLAKTEINKRVELVIKALSKQQELEANFKKINKNDIITYIESVAHESMSKQRFDQIAKEKEKKERLSKTLEEALTQNTSESYERLSESLKKLDNNGGNSPSGGGEGK